MADKNRQTKRGGVARAERLKQALRQNLKRRKAQQKGRLRDIEAAATHDSAGFAADKPKG